MGAETLRAAPSGTARLVITDDHELARAGLRSMLASERDVEVVGEASNGSFLLVMHFYRHGWIPASLRIHQHRHRRAIRPEGPPQIELVEYDQRLQPMALLAFARHATPAAQFATIPVKPSGDTWAS
jgi:hypothetical protein